MKRILVCLMFLFSVSMLKAQEAPDTVDVGYIGNMKKLPSGTLVRWKVFYGQVTCRDGKDAFMRDMYSGIKVLDAEDWMQPLASVEGTDIGIYECIDGVPTYRSLHDANTAWYCDGYDDNYWGTDLYMFPLWLGNDNFDVYLNDWICNRLDVPRCYVDSIQTEEEKIQAYILAQPKDEWNPNESGTVSSWQVYQDFTTREQHQILRVVDQFDICKTPISPDLPIIGMQAIFLPDGENYTFWGRGVSQGHSNAIRNIEGVQDARQYTVPAPLQSSYTRNVHPERKEGD